VYDFLRVINSNLGHIFAPFLRYGDVLAKNRKLFSIPFHLAPLLGVIPFEFAD